MQYENNVYDDVSDIDVEINTDVEQRENVSASPRRSTHSRSLPTYLQDFEVSNISNNAVSTEYQIHSFLSYKSLSDNCKQTIMLISSDEETHNYEEAIMHSSWIQAMKEELKALEENKTWSLTKLPLGKTTIGCRWIYKIKHKVDGSVERYKARLVAKDYTQIEGLNFFDTFALVAKLTTIRLLLSLATIHNWTLKQLDVNNSFLHGELD